jgi:hypothetical protein
MGGVHPPCTPVFRFLFYAGLILNITEIAKIHTKQVEEIN